MSTWFPLAKDLMEGDLFRSWTPSERLYYLRLLDEANERGGPFYRSDLWLSAELGVAERTIRQARKKARDAGWIVVVPGRQDRRGRGLATQYVEVKWASVEEGQAFSKMDRWAFRLVVDLCGRRELTPADVIVYVALWYWRGRHFEHVLKTGEFFISKRDLRELTGLLDAPSRLERIRSAFQFYNGRPLLQFEGWHQIRITDWATPAPPDHDERSARFWADCRKRVEEMVERERDRRIEEQLARWRSRQEAC